MGQVPALMKDYDIPGVNIALIKRGETKWSKAYGYADVSFSYSNTGYNLLELLIEEVTGRDFAEYMKEEVLIPYRNLNEAIDMIKNYQEEDGGWPHPFSAYNRVWSAYLL